MKLADLLTLSAERGASDMHLTAGLPPLIRVDGDIGPLFDEPVSSLAGSGELLGEQQVLALLHEVMQEDQRREFESNLEIDFSYELPGVARFRVNAFHQNRGAGAVFRTIPSDVVTMQGLGLGPIFQTIADAPRGLVIVTGPTGSGKSTTLAAFEITRGTPAIRNLIREDKVAQMYSSIQTGSAAGMNTLDQALKELVDKGLVRAETAKTKAKSPEHF